jgi:hypothetical protein
VLVKIQDHIEEERVAGLHADRGPWDLILPGQDEGGAGYRVECDDEDDEDEYVYPEEQDGGDNDYEASIKVRRPWGSG